MDKLRQEYNDKLNQAKAPINKEALWEKIATDKQFPVRKNSPQRGLWLMSLLMIGLVIISLFFWNQSQEPGFTKNDKVNLATEKNDNQNIEIVKPTENITLVENTNDLVNDHELNPSTSKVINKTKPSEAHHPKLIEKATPTTNTKSAIASQSNTRTNPTAKVTTTERVSNADEKITYSNSNSNSKPTTTTVVAINNLVQGNQAQHKGTVSETSNAIENESLNNIFTNNQETTSSNSAQHLTDIRAYLVAPDFISLIQTELSFLRIEDLDFNEVTIVNNQSPRWRFGLATGVGYHKMYLKSTTILSDNSVEELRIRNTKALESYRIQMDLHREIKKNWQLGIGLQYTKIFEEYIYGDSTLVYVRNDPKEATFFSANQSVDTYHNFHELKLWGINLNLKRVWDFEKVSLAINAGGTYNFSFDIKGIVTEDNLREVSIHDSATYKSKLGFRSYAGAELIKPMLHGETFFSVQLEQSSSLNVASDKLQHSIIAMYALIGYRQSF